MTSITIYGPNLSGPAQRKGQFHVHASGCQHSKQYGPGTRNGGDDRGWTLDVETKVEVADEINSDFIAEGSCESGEMSEIHFAPCTKKLPVGTPAEQPESMPEVSVDEANAEVAAMIADAAEPVEPPHGRLVVDRVNKRTGHRVVLVDGATSDDFDPDEGGRWVLFCCGHGEFVQVEGQRPARDLHGSPQEWCHACQTDTFGENPHEDPSTPQVSERVKQAQQAKPKRQARRAPGGDVTETTILIEDRPGGITMSTVAPTGERSVWASEIATHSEALRRAEALRDLCGYPVRDLCPGLAATDDPDAVEASYGRSWHRTEQEVAA